MSLCLFQRDFAQISVLNPLYNGSLFHCYMLDKSICHFRCWVYFVTFLFLVENPVNNVDPNQMPHPVASDLGLHCLPVTLLRGSR